jgi:hypothetical protein
MKKGVGSISQRYGSEDPDLHQHVTDPEDWRAGGGGGSVGRMEQHMFTSQDQSATMSQ